MWEATVAGTAAGAGRHRSACAADDVTYRAQGAARHARATRTRSRWSTCASPRSRTSRAKALWQPATLRELYCTFAEPHAIGLSSIAGLLHPVARTDPHGVAVRGWATGVDRARPGRPRGRRAGRGGRGRARCGPATPAASRWPAAPSRSTASARSSSAPATPVTVTLAHDGPRVLDVRAALAAAAAQRLLVRETTLQSAL